MIFFTVEKFIEKDKETILTRQRELALANGEEWIEPAERLRLEQEQAEKERYESAVAELKAKCDKKGLNFEEEKAKLDAKLKKR